MLGLLGCITRINYLEFVYDIIGYYNNIFDFIV